MKRIISILGSMLLIGFLVGVVWQSIPDPVSAAAPQLKPFLQTDKPVEGWIVCRDLGVGPAPGVTGNRQRFRLCHQGGWVVSTYCLRPELPAPMLGGMCTRISEDTYNCGNGLQPLREYEIRQTPTATPQVETSTPTPTATATSTSTPTSTLPSQPRQTATSTVSSPTPIPTRRPSPGGDGFRQALHAMIAKINPFPAAVQVNDPTPTPFRPLHPTSIPPTAPAVDSVVIVHQSPVNPQALPVSMNYDGIDFQDGAPRLNIHINPDNHRLNTGKAIQINVQPGGECEFGDGQACANSYRNSNGTEIIFLTTHSGIGGQAQSLRNALEGTGFDQAGLPLRQVRKNLQALLHSQVAIRQADTLRPDLEILAAVRIPANKVQEYIDTPVNFALAYAAQVDPDLAPFVDTTQPLIVIETCGWRMPEEAKPDRLPDTSASIYIIVIGTVQASP